MGVTGLWKLIEQSGTPVPLDTLENKILAVDISIWLHQSVKGFQDSSGAGLQHAHLLGLYHRICKLLYYRIRPVFVFDGGIPHLKRETMRKRAASKTTFRLEADRLQQLLAKSLEREKLLRHALGEPSTSTAVSVPSLRTADKDDMFKLPPMPENEMDTTSSSLDQSTSSVEECTSSNYNVNLQTIDVTSKHFLSLPAEVRHEILTDIKGMRKESSWGRLHELPDESNAFSGFQMQRLLKRRQVQQSLETAEQEMGGKTLTFGEIETLLEEDGIVEPSKYATKRVLSDENTRFLHVRNLKQAMRDEEKKLKMVKEELEEGSPPKKIKLEEECVLSADENEDEDEQLQRAIQMSLEECQIVAGPSTTGIPIPFDDIKTEVKCVQESPIKIDDDSDVSSNADSDFIDVPDVESDTSLTIPSQMSFELQIAAPPDPSLDFRHSDLKLFEGKHTGTLEVVIDPAQNPLPEEDLFADVFKVEKMKRVNSFESLDDLDEVANTFVNSDSAEIKPSPAKLKGILDKLNAEISSLDVDSKKVKVVTDTIVNTDTASTKLSSGQLECILSKLNAEIDSLTKRDNKGMEIEGEDARNTVPESLLEKTSLNQSIELDEEKVKNDDSDTNTIELLSSLPLPTMSNDKIIEINDDDDEPTKAKPMKQTDIASFIQVTPTKTKPTKEPVDTTPPPKVASPFFRKKTPTSSSKKSPPDQQSPIAEKLSKKSLFQEPPEPLLVKTPLKSYSEVVDEVAHELRQQLGVGELSELAEESRQNTRDLLLERNKQDRMGTSITERMSAECKHLLRIFGIPFVVAPMEAEAQCAYLDAARLTDGTITDDSDIWLFGGRTVYKHFFNQDKSVMEFRSDSVKRLFNVERDSLIQMAMLVGSDYTTGVAGVGMVTALEILSAFPSTPSKENVCNEQVLIAKLRKFKEWLLNSKAGTNVRLRTKLKNVSLSEEFPNAQVAQLYLYPKINDKLEAFSWRAPDAETLREFAKTTFGWTFKKTDDTLLPVLKRMNEKRSQVSIRNYFASQGIIDRKEVTVSKRVRKAIDQMANGGEEDECLEQKKEKPKRVRKPKATKTPDQSIPEPDEDGVSCAKPGKRGGRVPRELPSTSSAASKSSAKAPRVPDFTPPIRQRELAAAQQEKIKADAIAVFKASKKRNARNTK